MSATPAFSVSEPSIRNGFEPGVWSFSKDEQTRVIDLMTALQSNLDIEQTLATFGEHVQDIMPHAGIAFSSVTGPAGDVDKVYGLGQQAGLSWRVLLYVSGRELGWLEIHLDDVPTLDQQRQVEKMLRYLVHPLHNAVRFDRVRELALTDELTGLGSRSAFSRAIRHEVSRVRRAAGHANLALLVMDLDNFKGLNDQLGHLAGDQALRQAAQAARIGLRECDRLFRFGGDEFVAILPDVEDGTAGKVALRIEKLVRLTCTDPQLQLSVGAAQWQAGMEAEDLFDAGDQALYTRKRERKVRDQAITSSREPTTSF